MIKTEEQEQFMTIPAPSPLLSLIVCRSLLSVSIPQISRPFSPPMIMIAGAVRKKVPYAYSVLPNISYRITWVNIYFVKKVRAGNLFRSSSMIRDTHTHTHTQWGWNSWGNSSEEWVAVFFFFEGHFLRRFISSRPPLAACCVLSRAPSLGHLHLISCSNVCLDFASTLHLIFIYFDLREPKTNENPLEPSFSSSTSHTHTHTHTHTFTMIFFKSISLSSHA